VRESLTKLEVAKQQLQAGIWSLFHEQGAVAVHTVVAAAYQILDDLAYQQGLTTARHSPYIREGKQQRWCMALNHAQNFFKHADRDPDAILDFNPELSHVFLVHALDLYKQLTQVPLFFEGRVYELWFHARYKDENLLEEGAFASLVALMLSHGFDPENFRQIRLLLYSNR
jgi:hypothetical protein